jgi:hypothetical protein
MIFPLYAAESRPAVGGGAGPHGAGGVVVLHGRAQLLPGGGG